MKQSNFIENLQVGANVKGIVKNTPTINDQKQNGPEVAEDGKVFQVIPNTLLRNSICFLLPDHFRLYIL